MRPLVTVTSYGPAAGSARVRVFDWLDRLSGVDVSTHSYIGTASNSPRALARHPLRTLRAETGLRSLARSVGDSAVLLSRQATPLSDGAIEARILRAGARGIYDFDDALYLADGPRLFPKSRSWRRSVEAADVVIAGNETLADAAASVNGATTIVPSCVDPLDYILKTEYEITSTPRAVWIGSPSTEKYLQSIAPALLRLHASRGLRLSLVSAGNQPLGQLAQMTDRIEWSSATVASSLVRADVGIMPLSDDPWSRGKCAYKLLQYAATGLPLVASPVGANTGVLHSSMGLGPSTLDEWTQALETIIDEGAGTRAQRGRAARETVVEGFSFQAWESRWRATVGLS